MKANYMKNQKTKILWALDPFETHPQIIKKCISALKAFSPIPIEPVYVASPAQTRLNLEFSVPAKQRYQEVALAALQKKLRRVNLAPLLPPKVIVENHLTLSASAKALADYASRENAFMIVTGTRAKKGFSRFILGSFAETLLFHSKVGVLLVNPNRKPASSIHKILFATDFTPASKKAFLGLMPLARCLRAKILLHHVLCKPYLLSTSIGDIFPEQGLVPMAEFLRLETQQCRHFAKAFIALGKKQKVPVQFVLDVSAKSVAETILTRATAAKVSLIAMAAQSNRLETFLLGSASRRVLRDATRPVWIQRS